MSGDKSILEKFADTIKAAADAIVHPTAGTPMKMPLNESGYAITHLKRAKAKAKAPAKKTVKRSGRKPAKAARNSTGKSAAKQRAAKPWKSAAKTAGSKSARKGATKKKAGKSRR
jgi:hypothetical protein